MLNFKFYKFKFNIKYVMRTDFFKKYLYSYYFIFKEFSSTTVKCMKF